MLLLESMAQEFADHLNCLHINSTFLQQLPCQSFLCLIRVLAFVLGHKIVKFYSSRDYNYWLINYLHLNFLILNLLNLLCLHKFRFWCGSSTWLLQDFCLWAYFVVSISHVCEKWNFNLMGRLFIGTIHGGRWPSSSQGSLFIWNLVYLGLSFWLSFLLY